MWILISGNPVDGFSYYGPFLSSESAINFGDRIFDGDWWIVAVEKPSEKGE